MNFKRIKESIKLSYDGNTTSLLFIPLALLAERVFNKWLPFDGIYFLTFILAISLFPIVAVNYCYREDRSRFEKGLFIFSLLCSFIILGYYTFYYTFYNCHPTMDVVGWVGIGFCVVLWMLWSMFITIWEHKYKKLFTSDPASIKVKRPLEWGLMILVIDFLVLFNVWPA